jgi:uncharacterized HAD superfamily protein
MTPREIKKMFSKAKIIYCDIDYTITKDKDSGFNEKSCFTATPNLKMRDILNSYYYKGKAIIYYTSRRWSKREATEYWLQKNEFKYHAVVMQKPNYDVFICDKAVNAKDVLATL